MQRVAVDDRTGVAAESRWAGVAVHPGLFGLYTEGLDCTAHGEHRGVKNVDPVDLLDASKGHRPRDGALLDARRQHYSALRAKNLGVGETVDPAHRVEDHRGGVNRAGERAAAGFVDAADDQLSRGHPAPRRRPFPPYSGAAAREIRETALPGGVAPPC